MEDINFGEHLRTIRERAGLTRKELGERSGISEQSITAVERQRQATFRPDQIARLADVLGISTDILLKGDEHSVEHRVATAQIAIARLKRDGIQAHEERGALKRNTAQQASDIQVLNENVGELYYILEKLRRDQQALSADNQHLKESQHALEQSHVQLLKFVHALSEHLAIGMADAAKLFAALEGSTDISPDDLEAIRERQERWAERVDSELGSAVEQQFFAKE